MKKISIFSIILFGVLALSSCNKDEEKVVINPNAGVLTAPTSGTSWVLTENDTVAKQFTWTASEFGFQASVTYDVQIAKAGTSFADSRSLGGGNMVYSSEMSVNSLNNIVQGFLSDPKVAEAVDCEIRVKATVADSYDPIYSAVTSVTITPYIKEVSPIYLLGDATTVGWNNTAALEMPHLADGKYAIVASLSGVAGTYIKFIANLGAWAPQWGTDASGTAEAGNLVYRPTESVADPASIPTAEVAGDYRIVADIVNLTYEVTPVTSELYMLGDGTTAGWDNTAPLQMEKISPGIFRLKTTLGGDGLFLKFITTIGAWAPQYGTDASGTSMEGNLVFRPDETASDPSAIPCPSAAGEYTVIVNLAKMTYSIQ
ncbi:MAG TPA: hypothetical protein DEO70_09215 [Bacteroidales bacterium]|nr:MAG: hypothetical protein A2X11_15405 [Bacteroidetes bacterium GWE2_42_24]OFY31725.1 MAG: hypothetical protein A2X09_09150 [Bacteroidetes bacterium GWF2_43_11]HBZ67005.1 hypothetical protein [Bacteroidales bacterium]